MDVFELRNRLVEDYASYTRSFSLLAARPERSPVQTAIDRQLSLLLPALPKLQNALGPVAKERAAAQLASYERVREASTSVEMQDRDSQIATLLAEQPRMTIRELASSIGTSVHYAAMKIAALQKSGRLRRVGSSRAGNWEVQDKTEAQILDALAARPRTTIQELAATLGITARAVHKRIDGLTRAGRLRRAGLVIGRS